MSDLTSRDIPFDIDEIMHTAYLQYALSVNVGRAIPDVRDGLKPVNRRILYAMRMLNLIKSRPTAKCARVVGEVMGKYHPHGDAAIYDALVRLAQDFAMRYPLVEGQGNFGTIDGDPAAASRYTECRMERLTEELLSDIDKETVDMVPNFDEEEVEPSVLPAGFPNLLVNGSTGIGVGMATNIPTHNLAEVINATIALMDNPGATVDELMEFLPGPDFPTGATIRGRYSLRQLYATGRGSVKLRAKAEIVEKDGREQIVITEIPYSVNKTELVMKIAELHKNKIVTGISDLRDETSDRQGMRIVVDVKRGVMGSVVLNQLYAHTSLETTIGCTMLVVDHNRPIVMNLAEILQAYIDHRLEVITRRTQHDLKKARARAHILEGFLVVLDHLDEVVRMIREARTRADAAAALTARFGFSEAQVKAILEMRLYQLTGMAMDDVRNEFSELQKQIAYYEGLLASREKRLGVIRDELIVVRDKYSDPRRTEIVMDDSDLNIADLIPRHSCVITVSSTGYIKRVPASTYKTQHRGGKGIIGMETKEEDHVEHLFNSCSHDLIFFFTNRGFMYWLNVYEIPEGSRTGKGKAIVNMIKIEKGESIRAMLTVRREELDEPDKFIVTASKRGYIKKTPISLFKNLRRVGLRALTIEDDDDLIGAAVTENGNEVLLSSRLGMACRFDQNNEALRPLGRTARGVIGMKFKLPGDDVVSMEIIHEHLEGEIAGDEAEDVPEVQGSTVPENADAAVAAEDASGVPENTVPENADAAVAAEGPQVLVVTNGGMGKRSCVADYRKTRRGALGVRNIRLREGEEVLDALQVVSGDELIITTAQGQLVRIPADEIRTVGRLSQGVRIMNLAEGDVITGIAKLVTVPEEEEAEALAAKQSEAAAAEQSGTAAAEAPLPEPEAPVDGE